MSSSAASTSATTSAQAPTKTKTLEIKEETSEDRLKRARTANDRFKRRGKRPQAAVSDAASTDNGTKADADAESKEEPSGGANKKLKSGKEGSSSKSADDGDDEYLKQVRQYDKSLKDEGAGKRPLVR